MKKGYIVCLCFGREKCELQTMETAERNNTKDWEVVPVSAPYSREPAYRGIIYLPEEIGDLYNMTAAQVWAAWKAQKLTAGELADWQQRHGCYFDERGGITRA